jgi:hypothetical protein
MPLTCWVCGQAIEPREPSVPAAKVPKRYAAHAGKAVHLRCQGEWALVRPPPKRAASRVSTAPSNGCLLFAEDVAAVRGISRQVARRWLVELEERHGAAVVGRMSGRRGPRRFTTEAALEAVSPRVERETRELYEMVMQLAERLGEIERRLMRGS